MDSRLSFLFANSSDIFCIADITGNIVHTNHAFIHLSGFEKEEIAGKNIIDFYHHADRKRNEEVLRELPVRKNIDDYEARFKSKNGRFFNIRWSLSFSERDQLFYAVGVYIADKIHARDINDIAVKIQHVIASLNEGFFMLDKDWHITIYNPAFQAIIGLPGSKLDNVDFRQLEHIAITKDVMTAFKNAFINNVSSQVQYYDQDYKGWLRLNIYPYKDEVSVFVRDITNVRIQQAVLALEKNVLEINVSQDYTLPQIINELLKGIEVIFPEMYCSVLEVDAVESTLRHLAAPRLPAKYCDDIDGLKIGPSSGSCGTAAFHRDTVIVKDIEHNPLWDDYRQLILPHGFKACWSTPVISSHNNKVLATFGIYYTTIREPRTDELQMIERTVNILRVIIESKRNEESLAEQNKRLLDIASISSHEIRRPVATILGLVNLFDTERTSNPLNREVIDHLRSTSTELDKVIHMIIEKTVNIR